MTKLEALAKDCIENHTHRLIDRPSKQDIYTREESIYISGYKECERQNKNKITELEQKLEQTEKDLTDYQFNYPKIKDLEKENAELKENYKKRGETIISLEKQLRLYIKSDNKLTKAKEIIREYSRRECEYCDYKRNPDYVTMHCSQCQKYPLHKKAEQFLKDCDIDNAIQQANKGLDFDKIADEMEQDLKDSEVEK